MARQRLRASRAVLPPPADDFKRIRGIGPAIERRLHRAGIRTFARLAALSPVEVAALIPNLSAERVATQGWIRQALKLAPKQTRAKPHKEKAATTGRQHYANFTVELLLDENDEARRTRVAHVQSGDADTWAGWESERLIDFVARHTVARAQAARPVSLVAATPKPFPPVAAASESASEAAATSEPVQPVTIAEPAPSVATAIGPFPQIAATPEPIPPAAVERAPSPVTPTSPAGVLRLRSLETVPTNVNKPQSILPYGQAFEVRLSLDLMNLKDTGNSPLDYTVAVYAKNVGGGPRQVAGEAQGVIEFAESITLIVNGTALPRGFYRLEAAVTLTPASTTLSPRSSLQAWLEGGLLQVY